MSTQHSAIPEPYLDSTDDEECRGARWPHRMWKRGEVVRRWYEGGDEETEAVAFSCESSLELHRELRLNS